MSTTVMQAAKALLRDRPISERTLQNYLQSVRSLGLEDLPYESLSAQLVATRLSGILTQSTRRKHAVNIQAIFGLKVKRPSPQQKIYELPPVQVLHDAIAKCRFPMHGFAMLYAGLRLGESCVNQSIKDNVIYVDRQRGDNSQITAAKSAGPVYVQDWFADEYRTFDFNQSQTPVYLSIKRALKRVSSTPLTPHSLRHAFATNLVKAGATPEILKRQMRHSDITLALRYYVQTTEADIQRIVDIQQMSRSLGQVG